MDVAKLEIAIEADRSAGLSPFLIVATAGTVNTGAIDPLEHISEVARKEGLWFHVDGAIGALAAFSPALRPLISGIEKSDLVALDFHKWGHVPYDAGLPLGSRPRRAQMGLLNSAAYCRELSGEQLPEKRGPATSAPISRAASGRSRPG